MIEKLRHPDAETAPSFAPILLSWLHWFIPSPIDPDGYLESEPLSDHVQDFFFDYCTVTRDGLRRLHSEAAIVLPKGCAKSEIAAMLALAEVFGPTVPVGIADGGETYIEGDFVYTYAAGEVMADVRPSPEVTILATTKAQAKKTCYNALWRWCGGADNGGSARLIDTFGLEPGVHVGMTQLTTPDGFTIRVSSAANAADAADGGHETLLVADESHRMRGSIKDTFASLAGNVGKRGGNILHSTTIYATGEDSVLEDLYSTSDDIRSGATPKNDLLIHHSTAPPDADWSTMEGVEAAITEAYLPAPWVQIGPIMNKFFDRRNDVGYLKRVYAGIASTPSARWLDGETLAAVCSAPADFAPPSGAAITLGIDASRGVRADAKYLADCTVLIGCTVPASDDDAPVVWPVKIWTPTDTAWQLDVDDLDRAVAAAHDRWTVQGCYADPPLIEGLIAGWEKRHGRRYKARAAKTHPVSWWTNRPREMGRALEHYERAMLDGRVVLADHADLRRHHRDAHRRPTRSGYYIGKARKDSNNKIDAAIGATLAYTAATDAVRAGAQHQPQRRRGRSRSATFLA